MAGGLAFVTDPLGIVELRQVCADLRARSLELFEQLGAWVATTTDGRLQRLFAEACHRHAWHAELWQLRSPTIPVDVHRTPPAGAASDIALDLDLDAGRCGHYRQSLTGLRNDVHALRPRVDPMLDPSSRRTIDLVAGDLDDLVSRLDALPAD